MASAISSSSPLPSTPPPGAWKPLLRAAQLARRPLERFLRIEAASGILLLIAAAVALFWANSPWGESYEAVWQTSLGLRFGSLSFERTLHWFVNDVLMVVFFFVVGMEIRREVDQGELSQWRRAALPAAAAFGGMIVPAAIYLVVADEATARVGWGVPMATDIAFAVGILTLLGKRVPAALRVLLLALAVIDDLGAIVVIALFYSSGVDLSGILVALAGFVALRAFMRFGVRTKVVYVFPAFVVWAGIYSAGIHPTIAGVIIGLLTPVRAWLGPQSFLDGVRQKLDRLALAKPDELPQKLAETLRHVDAVRHEVVSPAASLIETLHPWVAFMIMPIFALANAGVVLDNQPSQAIPWAVTAAVATGLVIGKPAGILGMMLLTLRLKIAVLPVGVNLRHLVVLGVVAGVGFTMALFIAQLAFANQQLLAAAKLGVLSASGSAALLSLGFGWLLLRPQVGAGAARTVDEAERSTLL